QRHRQRADDKHDRVDAAEPLVLLRRADRPRLGIENPVDPVRQEHAAEEEDLRRQEEPHPERGGLVLLPEVLEVMLEEGVGGVLFGHGQLRHSASPPSPSAWPGSRTRPTSPPASRGSSPLAAATTSPTPARPRPTGSGRPCDSPSATRS